jgi:uncharacterized protein YggU (UPF0235/DUF167 family)
MTIYTVLVKPNSKKGPLVENVAKNIAVDYQLVAYLRAKAVEGEANKQLVEVIAKHFATRKSAVRLLRGEKSRIKHIEVQN